MLYVAIGMLFVLIIVLIMISSRKGTLFTYQKFQIKHFSTPSPRISSSHSNHSSSGKILKKFPRLPTLELYSRDLTLAAHRGELDPVVGRDKEIYRVIQILIRRTKNNPILIGKAGVGKTAIAEGLAQTLLAHIWDEALQRKRVLSLDLPALLAGTKFRGEFEKRLQYVMQEMIAAERSVILFIDEIHSLANAGEATGGIGAADIFKPALARGDLQVIGATTPGEYESIIKKDTTLDRRFQPVHIKEPNFDDAVHILEALKPRYSSYHGVSITHEAIETAVRLSEEKIPSRHLPDKAIDVMDEAASFVRLQHTIHPHDKDVLPDVTSEHIIQIINQWNKV